MGSMREIVDAAAVGHMFALLAILGPILGLGIGALLGVWRKKLRQGALTGLFCGLLGPLNWLLWKVYNAITDANGLDTVRNLLINLALFIGVGAAIGFGIGRIRLRYADQKTIEGKTSETPD